MSLRQEHPTSDIQIHPFRGDHAAGRSKLTRWSDVLSLLWLACLPRSRGIKEAAGGTHLLSGTKWASLSHLAFQCHGLPIGDSLSTQQLWACVCPGLPGGPLPLLALPGFLS